MIYLIAALAACLLVAGTPRFLGFLSDRLAAHLRRLLEESPHHPLSAVAGLLLGPSRTTDVARCPVCSQDCGEGSRACSRCGARHHADCFQYNGRCGIFGCGGEP